MQSMKFWPTVLVALVLSACGGGSGGLDGTASAGDTTLRLASEVATVKPWDGSVGGTLSANDSDVAPTKTSLPAAPTVMATSPGSTTVASPMGWASGAVSAYDPGKLPVIGGEPSASALWPTWRQGMTRWQWKQIPGSDISAILPEPRVPGQLSSRIDAWNGLAADTSRNRLFSAANGGHADYSGNEVYQIDLSHDNPSWTMLRAPTASEFIVASDYTKGIFNDYYLDGRPASTHTYYALNFISSRNAVFKFGSGSLWGTGNEGSWKTDAFSLDTNDWHPASTWPDATPGSRAGALAAAICKHPVTEQIYLATPGNLRRFNPATGQFDVLAAWPENASAVYARSCAVDSIRERVVFFGDGYRAPSGGLMYDIASNKILQFNFSGDRVPDMTAANYNFAWFEPKIGQFLLKTLTSGQVLAIDPVTFVVQDVGTTGADAMPNAMNGVHTRWQRLPNLGGYAYYPRSGSGVWFLAVE